MPVRFRLDLDFPPDRYEYTIGEDLLAELGQRTARLALARSCVVVTDENLAATQHVAAAEQSLRRGGLEPPTVIVPAGEASKSVAQANVLWERFAEAGLAADSVVVAVGGGVV